MAPEPKKPIEEMLEASARARRAEFGGDPKMPNPMRAQLRDEIARLNRSAQLPERSWLARFWPQLSLATAVVAVLIAGAIFWSRTQTKMDGPMQLAMNAPESSPQDATAALRSLDAPQADRLAKSEDKKNADAGTAAQALPEPAVNLAGTAEMKSFKEVARASAPAAAARPLTTEHRSSVTNLSQRFSQNVRAKTGTRGATKPQTSATILNTFDVQQEGNKIRVVDEDGSTYTGNLEPITPNDRRSLSQNFAAQSAARPSRPRNLGLTSTSFARQASTPV